MLKIISIGNKNEPWIQQGIDYYQKRLKTPFDINWVILASQAKDSSKARQIDSQTILNQLDPKDFVVLLDELGESMSSSQFSNYLNNKFTNSLKVVFVIGGAYGVDINLKHRANMILSISNFVLPHQLARLILTEQIYRSQEIIKSSPYHHN